MQAWINCTCISEQKRDLKEDNLPNIEAVAKKYAIEVTKKDAKVHLSNTKKDRHFHF
jgi:hypothetical protein